MEEDKERERRKREKKKGGYNTNWSVLAKEGDVRMRERKKIHDR